MDEMISICGLACHECGARIATLTNDDAKRAETAVEWTKQFGAVIEAKDINCLGCLSDVEPVFSHCKVCEIRLCGKSRGLANCAECADYGCDKIEAFFKMVPANRTRLDAIRAAL
jgi:hypothetical protein